MAGETILIIDADEDTGKRMTAVFEAEGYLSYNVSNQDVNAQLADLLKPSLIYIKPSNLRPSGFDRYKTIHRIPLLMKVPVVILVSLKKPPGPTYVEEYGIVDFLEPTFSTEELIQKTATILGKSSPSTPEESLFSEHPKEEEPTVPIVERSSEKKGPAFLLPVIGLVVVLVIAGAAYLFHQKFMVTKKSQPVSATKTPARAQFATPKVEAKPELPPPTEVANAPLTNPVPRSSAPSDTPPKASSVPTENAYEAPTKPFYSVQLGAFRDEETAATLTKKFKEKGYDAFTQPGVTGDKSPIYRVLVSKYEDRKAAQKMAGEIQIKEQVKTILYGE